MLISFKKHICSLVYCAWAIIKFGNNAFMDQKFVMVGIWLDDVVLGAIITVGKFCEILLFSWYNLIKFCTQLHWATISNLLIRVLFQPFQEHYIHTTFILLHTILSEWILWAGEGLVWAPLKPCFKLRMVNLSRNGENTFNPLKLRLSPTKSIKKRCRTPSWYLDVSPLQYSHA